jgi:DNA-binding LytR/AlgR family response regulator
MKMYCIGICDDGVNVCSFIEKCLLEQAEKERLQIDIDIWNTGEDLQKFLQEGNHIDILFLDIELFELTGLEVGSYIRNQLNDRAMQIIYISGKSSYAQSLFKTQPMDFLVKPLKSEEIAAAFSLAVKILSEGMKRFEFQAGKNYYYLPYNEIIYFTSAGRVVRLATQAETLEFYGKLRDIEKKLPQNFIKIHQSYIVNNEYVRRYTYEMVELLDGTVLSISKPYRKQVRQRFLQEG